MKGEINGISIEVDLRDDQSIEVWANDHNKKLAKVEAMVMPASRTNRQLISTRLVMARNQSDAPPDEIVLQLSTENAQRLAETLDAALLQARGSSKRDSEAAA